MPWTLISRALGVDPGAEQLEYEAWRTTLLRQQAGLDAFFEPCATCGRIAGAHDIAPELCRPKSAANEEKGSLSCD